MNQEIRRESGKIHGGTPTRGRKIEGLIGKLPRKHPKEKGVRKSGRNIKKGGQKPRELPVSSVLGGEGFVCDYGGQPIIKEKEQQENKGGETRKIIHGNKKHRT